MKRLLTILLCSTLALSACKTTEDLFKNKHVCDENCEPFCQDIDKTTERSSAEKWESFKNYKPYSYRKCGNKVIDESAIIYLKLSNQLYTEVIIPYLESDADGNLAHYRKFKEQVELEMKRQNITKQEAATKLMAYIKETRPEEYAKIKKSFELIENRNFSNQLSKALFSIRNEAYVLIKILTNNKSKEMSLADGIALAQLLPELNRAISACSFLIENLNDADNEEIVKFIKEKEEELSVK